MNKAAKINNAVTAKPETCLKTISKSPGETW
jgi:hypothetical protein